MWSIVKSSKVREWCKPTSATPKRRHAASNASSSCTHELILLPSLEPLRRTGHLWKRESPSLLSTARGGTAARPAELRARRRSVPTVVSPAEISEEEEEEESARARLGTQLSSPPCKTKKKKAPSCWINDNDNLQVLNVFPQHDVQSSLFISPLSAQVCVFSKRLIY